MLSNIIVRQRPSTLHQIHKRVFSLPTEKCTLWGFGSNEEGQLGLQGKRVVYSPSIIYEGEVNSVACGHEHLLISLKDGTLMSSGSSKSFQSGQLQTVSRLTKIENKFKTQKVAAGKVHSIILSDTGEVYSFGNGAKGQLGYDSNDRYKPKEIESLRDKKVIDISCGTHTSFVITEDGRLLGWGCDLFFQLGNGDGQNILTPTEVSGPLKGKKIRKVAPGMLHTIALTTDNEVFMWGSNRYNQLAADDIKLSPIPLLLKLKKNNEKIVDIAVGWHHNIILTENGMVYSWGDNSLGQSGTPDRKVKASTITKIEIEKKIINIGCGNNHTLLVTEDNELYAFGSGTEHQLGLGESYSPIQQNEDDDLIKSRKAETNYLRNGTILYTPTLVPHWTTLVKSKHPNNNMKIQNIWGGDTHTVMLTKDS